MLKKLIQLNLDDLLLYLSVECGMFLVIQIIIGCVMHFARPETSVTVSSALFPIVGGFCALISGISHVGVSFEQAIQFGQPRRRALGLTLGLISFETAFALVLGAALAAVESVLCPALWAKLAGMDGWASGHIFFSPEGTTVDGLLVQEKVLLIESFTLEWYWWLIAFGAAVAGGIIAGAVIQRFGAKGGWFIWGICVAPMILGQLLPWEEFELTNWLVPMLVFLVLAGFLWSIWSLLHAVVRA